MSDIVRAVDFRERAEDREFRAEVRAFLEDSLAGVFAVVRGRGGPGDEHALFDERLAWERHLGAHGWTCVGWPKEHGGRGLPLRQQVIYFEEYARARGPGRLGHIGEGLVGPTLIAFGSPAQQRRFLPPIAAGEELWCQGYSEPNAGSDLANVQTRAVLENGLAGVDGGQTGTGGRNPSGSGGGHGHGVTEATGRGDDGRYDERSSTHGRELAGADSGDGDRKGGARRGSHSGSDGGDSGRPSSDSDTRDGRHGGRRTSGTTGNRSATWRITGQKVWTSLAQWADWCFVLARTTPLSPGEPKHRGLSYLLVPMRQDGVEIRPIVQLTGDSEFNEVFFDGATTAAENVVGEVGDGWRVAMGTLAFERGASTLGQQLNFRNELDAIVETARRNGRIDHPVIRQRLTQAHIGLEIMRLNALRTLSGGEDGTLGREALIGKLSWSTLHRALGELAVDVLGAEALVVPSGRSGSGGTSDASSDRTGGDGGNDRPTTYDPTPTQRLFLFTRADTIYGGSNQVQRNIIGERALGLPKEPKP